MKRVEREQVECFKKLLRVREPVNVLCDGIEHVTTRAHRFQACPLNIKVCTYIITLFYM
ncbi:hypothetical protein HanIR_Chr08g0364611 [Helianthus annuus]|nr:hypothetical protein HanIR_Chr08g0364611 [Helianthus annuus]